MEDVDGTINALKQRLNANSDSDLARKLSVDKRTISAWRSRGNVPDRYRAIAGGESPITIWTQPVRWGPYEECAFRLALFRFVRVRARDVQEATVGALYSIFGVAEGFWLLMHQSQKDIVQAIDERNVELEAAVFLVMDDDISAGEKSIARDAAILASA